MQPIRTQCTFYLPLKRSENRKFFSCFQEIEKGTLGINRLIDQIFQIVYRRFVLLFENKDDREAHTGYFLQKAEIKNQNVMNDEKNCFDLINH